MICKLQRPVAGDGPVLVYNRERSRNAAVFIAEPELTKLFGNRYKFYAECEWGKGADIKVMHEVGEQDW